MPSTSRTLRLIRRTLSSTSWGSITVRISNSSNPKLTPIPAAREPSRSVQSRRSNPETPAGASGVDKGLGGFDRRLKPVALTPDRLNGIALLQKILEQTPQATEPHIDAAALAHIHQTARNAG